MTAAVLPRPARARPSVREAVPLLLAVLLVLTAIAYPLTSGSGRDAVSWTIVVLGATLSVAHAALSRGLRAGLGVLLLVAVTAVAFEAVGLATGVPVRQLHATPTRSGRPCWACRSSFRWPG